jgi:hypothetical protein
MDVSQFDEGTDGLRRTFAGCRWFFVGQSLDDDPGELDGLEDGGVGFLGQSGSKGLDG